MRRARVAFLALVVGGVPALVAGFAGRASAAPVVPVAHLTLSTASGARLDANRCPLVTRGGNFTVIGRLIADAVGVGIGGQPVELSVDGRPSGVARTDSTGSYRSTLALDPAVAHTIQARLQLPTDATLLAATASSLASAIGIESPRLRTCVEPTTPTTTTPDRHDPRPVVPDPHVHRGRPDSDPGTGWKSIRFTRPVVANGRAFVGSVCESGFLCSVPGWDLTHLAHVRVAVVLLVFFCIAFPSALFNSTLEANYEQVIGWFGRSPAWRNARRASRRLPGGSKIAIFIFLAAAVTALADKSMRGGGALAGFLGLSVAIALTVVAFELPEILQARRHRLHYAGAIRAFPGGLIAAVACAAGSAALKLDQPYVYGIVAAFVVTRGTRDDREDEVGAAYVALSVGLMTIGAWVLWSLLGRPGAQANAPFARVFLGAVLAGTFMGGFEGMLINFLPLRFLDGPKLRAWNRHVWAAVEGGAIILLVLVLSYRDPGRIEATTASSHHVIMVARVVWIAFALGSLAFWGYFRLKTAKPPRTMTDLAPASLALEGTAAG